MCIKPKSIEYSRYNKMKPGVNVLLFLFILVNSCAQETKHEKQKMNNITTLDSVAKIEEHEEHQVINSLGTSLKTRIYPPFNFGRTEEAKNSFPKYLRNLPLKPHGSEVLLYDGSTKVNHNIYVAVIDMEIGNKNLHQCADAVMRFRAEYLWNQERYADIHFNLTNGFRVDYSIWMEGKRVAVNGNETYWVDQSTPSNTYQDFWEYMELIFNYAGTLSLSKELLFVEIKDMKIGDVFIWGGSPGHAILVMDIAENLKTKEKVFLLAQSYMPAQETHILQNPNNVELSPWYSVFEIVKEVITPEWTFNINELKRFRE